MRRWSINPCKNEGSEHRIQDVETNGLHLGFNIAQLFWALLHEKPTLYSSHLLIFLVIMSNFFQIFVHCGRFSNILESLIYFVTVNKAKFLLILHLARIRLRENWVSKITWIQKEIFLGHNQFFKIFFQDYYFIIIYFLCFFFFYWAGSLL